MNSVPSASRLVSPKPTSARLIKALSASAAQSASAVVRRSLLFLRCASVFSSGGRKPFFTSRRLAIHTAKKASSTAASSTSAACQNVSETPTPVRLTVKPFIVTGWNASSSGSVQAKSTHAAP